LQSDQAIPIFAKLSRIAWGISASSTNLLSVNELHIHNSLSRQKELFTPLSPPFVGIYVCGPTVYGNAHLGHARSAITFDIVFRYLRFLGYQVRYVRNITDVGHLVNDADEGESKVEKQARLEQLEPMEVAQRYYNSYIEDMDRLNLLRPSIEPRATGHIGEQIEMVQAILANGFAYEINGSVYFDVVKYDQKFGYGKLSGRDLENMLSESREGLEGSSEKRHPADFALWKKADANHLMRWNSPWGSGFPGWHLECTVMSTKYLGAKYDIHGGGMDLVFPHHEAEIAQSNASQPNAHQHDLDEANVWMHNNMITYEGKKMGKSLGNAIDLKGFFSGDHPLLAQAYSPMTIRFFMLQAHYRSTLDFSNEALQGAEKAFKRMGEALKRLDQLSPEGKVLQVNEAFETNLSSFLSDVKQELNDDFNTAKVIARMFEAVPVINSLAQESSKGFAVRPETFTQFQQDFRAAFVDLLGLKTDMEESGQDHQTMEGLMSLLIELRQQARQNKDYAMADQIRDRLVEVNIRLNDGAKGTEWVLDQ
jgi:cysteinyl-tRNA synthetase